MLLDELNAKEKQDEKDIVEDIANNKKPDSKQADSDSHGLSDSEISISDCSLHKNENDELSLPKEKEIILKPPRDNSFLNDSEFQIDKPLINLVNELPMAYQEEEKVDEKKSVDTFSSTSEDID